jgi:hypothetical protein
LLPAVLLHAIIRDSLESNCKSPLIRVETILASPHQIRYLFATERNAWPDGTAKPPFAIPVHGGLK